MASAGEESGGCVVAGAAGGGGDPPREPTAEEIKTMIEQVAEKREGGPG